MGFIDVFHTMIGKYYRGEVRNFFKSVEVTFFSILKADADLIAEREEVVSDEEIFKLRTRPICWKLTPSHWSCTR